MRNIKENDLKQLGSIWNELSEDIKEKIALRISGMKNKQEFNTILNSYVNDTSESINTKFNVSEWVLTFEDNKSFKITSAESEVIKYRKSHIEIIINDKHINTELLNLIKDGAELINVNRHTVIYDENEQTIVEDLYQDFNDVNIMATELGSCCKPTVITYIINTKFKTNKQ